MKMQGEARLDGTWRKHGQGPVQHLLQLGPDEAAARVLLASRGHMFMSCDLADRVFIFDMLADLSQCRILRCLERLALQALQLDADGVVVASLTPLPAGRSGMPGAVIAAYKLPDGANSGDKKV